MRQKLLSKRTTRICMSLLLILAIVTAVPYTSFIQGFGSGAIVNVGITLGASTKTTDAYSPNPVEISVGDTVIWTNDDLTPHTATSGTSPTPDGIFGGNAETGGTILVKGKSQSFTFTEAGEFPYFCTLHPTMSGTVLVGEQGSSDITVSTDQSIYKLGDDVIVSGKVSNIQDDLPAQITVTGEDGSLVRVDQVVVDSDGSYNYQFPLAGALFEENKSYNVTARYSGAIAYSTFQIGPSSIGARVCKDLTPTLLGTHGNDILNGTNGNDVILGLGGNDTIRGFGGDDVLCGGTGWDRISGGGGNDRIIGGRGSDYLFGDGGNDRIWGGSGWDRMFGGDGDDVMFGEIGRDRLRGGEGDDRLYGQEGDDIIDGLDEKVSNSGSDIVVELDDDVYGQGDDVTITGKVDGADDNDPVDITIHKPGGGTDNADIEIEGDDGDFGSVYEIDDNADDGVYQVEVEFGTEDPAFTFFIVDEEEDDVSVATDKDRYNPGEDVVIEGEVRNTVTGETEVEITVIAPDGEEILSSKNVDVDSSDDTFRYDDLTLDDNAPHGIYAVTVEYDGEEAGWTLFEVTESGGSSHQIAATLSESSYRPGDTVTVDGSIDENDVDLVEVFILVEDPDGTNVYDDSTLPDTDGTFDFAFDLDDNADEGTYYVTLSYEDYDDKVITFTV